MVRAVSHRLPGQPIWGVLHTLPQTVRADCLGGIAHTPTVDAPHAETNRVAKAEYQPVDLVLMNNHGSTDQQKTHNLFPQPARFLQHGVFTHQE